MMILLMFMLKQPPELGQMKCTLEESLLAHISYRDKVTRIHVDTSAADI